MTGGRIWLNYRISALLVVDFTSRGVKKQGRFQEARRTGVEREVRGEEGR